MKSILLLFAVSAVALAGSINLENEWSDFKAKHNKEYSTIEEESERYKIFTENYKKIQASKKRYQTGLETYFLEVNQFTDMTQDEFRLGLGFFTLTANDHDQDYNPSQVQFDTSVDWRKSNACNPARAQGGCRSCWAFTAAGVLESQYYITHGKDLPILSPQELVDCTRPYGNVGCGGGWPQKAFKYVRDHGIYKDVDYPYTGVDGTCSSDSSKSFMKSKRIFKVAENETVIQDALTNVGPVAIHIDAEEWLGYGGGIFHASKNFTYFSHTAIIDGYGSENGEDYWLIRNSWGPTWGEKGYIRVRRNTNEFRLRDGVYFPEI